MSDSVENLAEIERMDAEDAVDPTPQSVAPAADPDRVAPLMAEPRFPIVLADGTAGVMRRCGHCGGNLSIPAPGEPSSESPALDDEIAPEDIHVHYGPVGGVGVDPAPLLARIESLETSLQLAQGALRELETITEKQRTDLKRGDTVRERDREEGWRQAFAFVHAHLTANVLPLFAPSSPTGEEGS